MGTPPKSWRSFLAKSFLRKTPTAWSSDLLASYYSAAWEVSVRFPSFKTGTNFRGSPALPPCCKACALSPRPFIYALFGVLTGHRTTSLRAHRCEGLCMKTEQGTMQSRNCFSRPTPTLP
jgi:hypothetical protein